MSTLEQIRTHINLVDKQLVKLLDERMLLARDIADFKLTHSLPVFDAGRERQVLETIPEKYQSIWISMMDASKKEQERYISGLTSNSL